MNPQLRVEHETRYVYAARVDVAHQQMHLTPRESERQTLVSFALQIEPPPAQCRSVPDTFGNIRTLCALYTPHDELRVLASSLVQMQATATPPSFAGSPPWEQVRDRLRFAAGRPFVAAAEFVPASPFVPLLPALRAYALECLVPGRPWLDGAQALMQRIHDDFTYDPATTDVATPIALAFAQRSGVCQDFAHILIGCLRAIGLPAAYVSGYLLTRPPPGQPRLLGVDASHAWVSLWCPVNGWIDLDPTNAVVAGADHVTLAVGRDYGDVMPLRGVIRGGASHRMTVAVSVVPA
jgi:transglutaminase-like putative cysteine protease